MEYTFKTGSDLADFVLDFGRAEIVNGIIDVADDLGESWIDAASRLDDLEYLNGGD